MNASYKRLHGNFPVVDNNMQPKPKQFSPSVRCTTVACIYAYIRRVILGAYTRRVKVCLLHRRPLQYTKVSALYNCHAAYIDVMSHR